MCFPPSEDPMCLELRSMYGSFISGSSEVPPIKTNATGLAFLVHHQISDTTKDVMKDIVIHLIN